MVLCYISRHQCQRITDYGHPMRRLRGGRIQIGHSDSTLHHGRLVRQGAFRSTARNTPSTDFVCPQCLAKYQVKSSTGDPCAAPARRGTQFCVFHEPVHNSERPDYSLAVIEDATSLQFGIMQVMRALADHAIDAKTAALMLYGLQIAASNLKRFTAEQPDVSSEREQSLAELLLERLGLDEELGKGREGYERASAGN